MNSEEKILKGSEGFYQYFSDVYGDEWPAISDALKSVAHKVEAITPQRPAEP